jgi:ABC-2 type transport system permease protein
MTAKTFEVAYWEFMEKVKSKAFIISLILMPVIIVAMGILPTIFATKEDDSQLAIGFIDESGIVLQPLVARVEQQFVLASGQPNYVIRNLKTDGTTAQQRAKANGLVASGNLEGYFYIPASAVESGRIEYRAKNVGNFKIQERFTRTIQTVLQESRFAASGIDTALIRKLRTDVDVKMIKLSDRGVETETGFGETFISAYIGLLMIIFMVLTSGQLLVRSVLEEKSNRVMEVLLSSCSAKDLMAGKILGLSGLGILQMAVYALIGVAFALKTNTNVLVPEFLFLSLVYAMLGYLFYAAIFVAAGSPVTTEQEAQQITGYISMFLVAPFALMMLVLQNPNSLLVKILSFIPVLTPTMMVMRIPIQMPATWEILATILSLLLSTVAMMWVAGKIFRIAILSYGKRPSMKELMTWIRND